MTYSEIHVWGDSLARGIIYNENRQRYAISGERCTGRLSEALGCKVENHSVMGATILDGFKNFSSFPVVPDALCAIEYGGNDCDLDWAAVAEHPKDPIVAKVPLELYTQTLKVFVALVRERGMHPLLVTSPPLDAPRYFDWVTRNVNKQNVLAALGDVNHIYRWQERYTIALRQTAFDLECPLLDIRDWFLALNRYEDYICVDGIHPNDRGHRLIADAVLERARKDGAMPLRSGDSETQAI
ncbi:MAG: SGNH/GDSL hydrolase family protein [Eubacteriales bacterium]|nr:SGNH/GDSL hydrolase family protein [Eubacteriales bacterium]